LYTFLDGLRGVINLLLSLVLGYKIGAAGVAIGTAIPCIIFDVLLKPYYACKSINASPFRLLCTIVRSCMQTCILMAPVWLIIGRNLPGNYYSLFRVFIIHSALLLIVGIFAFLSKDEREQVRIFVKVNFIERIICRRPV